MNLLKNLEKWQAASHSKLANSKPDELFQEDFVDKYNRLHNNLWSRMIRLHGTIHTLEQLEWFPLDYLYGPHEGVFWHLVTWNFYDIAFLLLHGLYNDSGVDAHTLLSFKNQILQWPWLDSDMLELLIKTLQERKFNKDVQFIATRVKKIRNNIIAHQLMDKQSGELKEELVGTSLNELRQLFDATHAIFGALSFGSAYATLHGDLLPGTIGGKPKRTCLDEVLDAVLRDSYFVNKPEHRKKWWPMERKYIDPEQLKVMNDCRKRIGLPEA